MLIPVSDENEDFEIPYINYAIYALCAAVFCYEMSLTPDGLDFFVSAFGFSAHSYINGAKGLHKAALAVKAVFDLTGTVWVTAFTSQFIHGGYLHILGNLFFLWIFGDNVEHVMGRVRYAAFFLLCGVLANLTQAVVGMDSAVPCIGASGAISGVMGAYLVFYPRALINMYWYYSAYVEPFQFRVKARTYLVFFFLTQVATGFLTWGVEYFEVAVWAHIGGFLWGAALAWVFKDPAMMFMDEAHKILGLAEHSGDAEKKAYHEYVKKFGRVPLKLNAVHKRPGRAERDRRAAESRTEGKPRWGWVRNPELYAEKKVRHQRPALSEMRQRGKEEAERRKRKGSDWMKPD